MDRYYFVPHTWELDENDIAAIEESEIGDTLQIDEPVVPLVFEDGDGYCIFAFASQEAVPAEYLQEEYAIMKCDLQYISIAMMAVEKLLGKAPILAINPFDDGCTEMTLEQIQALL